MAYGLKASSSDPLKPWFQLKWCVKKMKVVDRFSSTSVVTGGRRATERTEGAGIFFQTGSQIYKKSALIKLRPPYFSNKIFYDPHHRYTLPPKQAKNCIEISLFEQNKHTTCICGHFVTPYILWPPYFLSKNLWTPSIFGTPLLKKMPAP